MSQGTLYANFRIRTWVPRGLVKALKLDINVVAPETASEQFAKDFPLKKVPAFVGPNGFKLTGGHGHQLLSGQAFAGREDEGPAAGCRGRLERPGTDH